jgi:hypothetical protein
VAIPPAPALMLPIEPEGNGGKSAGRALRAPLLHPSERDLHQLGDGERGPDLGIRGRVGRTPAASPGVGRSTQSAGPEEPVHGTPGSASLPEMTGSLYAV